MAPGQEETYDGFRLHCLKHRQVAGHPRFIGLRDKLADIRPDVVQSFLSIGWVALDAALLKSRLDFKLFTAAHTTASVFPLANRESSWAEPARLRNLLSRWIPGRFVSRRTEKCYAATSDCADVAVLNTLDGFSPGPIIEAVFPEGIDTVASNVPPITNMQHSLDTDSPTIYTGSPNFSKASEQSNDENVLEIKGNAALGHAYVAEFMRLYNHYRARAIWNEYHESGKKTGTRRRGKDAAEDGDGDPLVLRTVGCDRRIYETHLQPELLG
jgi:hypothetical protein